MTYTPRMCSFASQYLGCCSASAAARIGSLPCFGCGQDVWHGNVPRRELHTLHLGAIAGNVLWLCVCYFGLQTFAFKDKFYSQNNSTKPLLVAGAVN